MTLSLYRFDSVAARLWAFAMMGLARRPLAKTRGLRFWKLCGSGTGEGFTPKPNVAVYAILCVWPDPDTARDQLTQAPVFQRYRAQAACHWTVFLSPLSVRGHWSGRQPFQPEARPAPAPIAALTRARVRPGAAVQFWRRVPNISRVIGQNRDVLFKIGLGEVPLLHQITFSIWPDRDSMDAFARDAAGPHAQAVAAVREGGWFAEELYARFQVIGECGRWENTPLVLQQKDMMRA